VPEAGLLGPAADCVERRVGRANRAEVVDLDPGGVEARTPHGGPQARCSVDYRVSDELQLL
jgi:hypothetical protein